MRLLVVSQYFWPENFRINDLVGELVRRGHDVTVLTGQPNYPDGVIFAPFDADPAAYSSYCGARIVRVPLVVRGTGGLRLLLNYLSFAVNATVLGAWRLRHDQFDVVLVCQLSPVTVGLPGAFLKRVKRVPMVLWVLDLWPETLQAIGAVRSPRLLGYIGGLVGFIYRRSDLILAQSHSFIPAILARGGAKCRVEYFPSWAEAVFNDAAVKPAPEVMAEPGSFNVVFAGNIGDAQDFPSILAAAELLRNEERIRWLIVGDGRLADWVKAEIVRRGLTERVLMLGRFPVERMPSFYRHADVLLVSLRDEALFAMTIPGKLQSYLAVGKPVVAMLNGEGADVIRRSGAGLSCDAGDAAGLAAVVMQLARSTPASLAEMGRRGRAMSESEFDRDSLIGRLERWLVSLVRSGRGS